MLDSGSEPTVANCELAFPDHPIQPSEGQRRGVKYVSATGGTVPNEGQVCITHRDPHLGDFDFVFQHAKVHVPIISVRHMVKDHKCRVIFYEDGGVIKYPDGRRLKFIMKSGVFFMLLNVVDAKGTVHQIPAKPVFSRQVKTQ